MALLNYTGVCVGRCFWETGSSSVTDCALLGVSGLQNVGCALLSVLQFLYIGLTSVDLTFTFVVVRLFHKTRGRRCVYVNGLATYLHRLGK